MEEPTAGKTDYNPYEYRTAGHITNLHAFLHLVKCSFGTGVLTLPYGFKNAGLVGGFILGIAVSVFCIYCFHLLIKNMMKVAADLQQPYVTFAEAVNYGFRQSYGWCQPLARWSSVVINTVIAGYHFGICTAYVNYLVTTSFNFAERKALSEGPVNWPRTAVTFIWVIPLFFINCLRDLRTLMPVSLIGNVSTLVSMLIILYYIVRPDNEGFSDTWASVPEEPWITMPLFIGTILFAVESFGVIVSVERDMKTPKQFLGWFGVFNWSMLVVVAWYLFIGSMGYLKYGKQVESTIVMTIPNKEYMGRALQLLMAFALYCSYPLQCFVVFDIFWMGYLEPTINSKKLMWEYIFRFAITLATGIISLLASRLDLIVSLVGAFSLSILGIILPGLLDYNYVWGKQKWSRPTTLSKDIIIIVLGFLALFIGTYSSLYGLVVESLKGAKE